MTGKMSPQTSTEPKDTRPRRAPAAPGPLPRPEAVALVQGLERLRDGLLHRLEQIETLALEQARLLEEDVSEREQALRERVAVLEAAQARLQAESRRREQEWQAVLQDLEADRRLLAEAWERLEREQIDAPAEHSRAAGASPAPPPAAERAPAHRPSAEDPADDAVARAILSQFQTLKSDVRRNAKERKGY